LPIGPGFLLIGGSGSVGFVARAGSVGGARTTFQILLNGQSPIV